MKIVKKSPNISGWNLQKGYTNVDYDEKFPFQSTKQDTLNVIFIQSLNGFEYKCNWIDQGIKVVLSTPGEALRMSQNYFRMPYRQLHAVFILPELITTTERVRNFKPHQRNCFYDDERQLRFFKMYTEINCEVECLANFTKTICECVKFSMPSMYQN